MSAGSSARNGSFLVFTRPAVLIACLAVAAVAMPARAETRSYVISYFTQAVYSEEGDCPGGQNPVISEQWVRDLRDAGKSPSEIEDILANNKTDQIVNRATINGKAVNVYANPQAVKDPNLTAAAGKHGFGFDLDGKASTAPEAFEDPDTHERGIDNQAARALGCFHAFRANFPERSSNWELWWGLSSDTMPAWLVTIEGQDLSRDGDVTVTLQRSLDHALKDARSQTRADVAFRVDPNPKSHNVFQGRLKDGVVTTTAPADVFMVGDALVITKLELHQARLKLKLKSDGTIDGVIGGYQPWKDIYFGVGGGNGHGYESNIGADLPGAYYLLKRLADAYPDPKTGQNQAISAAWRIEGVPAAAVTPQPLNGNESAVRR